MMLNYLNENQIQQIAVAVADLSSYNSIFSFKDWTALHYQTMEQAQQSERAVPPLHTPHPYTRILPA